MQIFRTFWLRALAALLLLPVAAALFAQSPAEIAHTFANPPQQYGPLVRWWWPGNDVDAPELQREIGLMAGAGIAGAEIQPFNAGVQRTLSPDATKRMNDYPSPSFFQHVADAVVAAKQHGMFIDYTFGSGWPFGGAEITPELSTVELRWSHQTIQGPGMLRTHLEIPHYTRAEIAQMRRMPDGWEQRFEKRAKIVAVVAVRGSSPVWNQNQNANDRAVTQTGELSSDSVILTSRMKPDGTLVWNVPPGTWQVFVYRSMPTLHRVHHGAGEGIQLELDHWQKAAFEAHAKAVGDDGLPYFGKYLGNGLRAIFCDSLEITNNFFWSDNFLAEFKRRHGYDLTPYLPILKTYGKGPRSDSFANLQAYDIAHNGAAVRRDYEQTLSDLMVENFFNPFNEWAHQHKLLSRVQAHGAAADVSRIYGNADIAETEDLAEGGTYQFLKLASSAAHVAGHHQVGSESFVWSGDAWQSTPLKLKRAADELLTAGVNAILYHGFPYTIAGFDAPGWAPFATAERKGGNFSESYNQFNTFWPYFPALNHYIRRIQYLSQTGTDVAQVAVYRYDLSINRHVEPQVPNALKQSIMNAGYNYDDINEDSLLRSEVFQKSLRTPGGALYRVLVIPSLDRISTALAAKLHDFASQGLPIVFNGEVPEHADSFLNAKSVSLQLQTYMHATLALSNVKHTTAPAGAVKALDAITAPDVTFHGESLPYIEVKNGAMRFFFFRNASDEAKNIEVTLRGHGKLEEWNAWTGTTERLASSPSGNGLSTKLHFGPVGSVLLALAPMWTTSIEAPAQRSVTNTLALGNSGWAFIATGMGPTGKTETIHRTMSTLTDWTMDPELKSFSGNGTYTTSFAAPVLAPGQHAELRLGTVGNAATIVVNGKPAGQTILSPYAVDVTSLLHPGTNTVEITVTNALFNAVSQRKPEVFSPGHTYTDSGLMPSGMLGPIELVTLQ